MPTPPARPTARPAPATAMLAALAVALAPLSHAAAPTHAAPDDDRALSRGLTQGMAAFAAGLDADQRDAARYAFDDDERFDLRLAPLGLEGLRIDEMTEAQWQALRSLLGRVLSAEGLAKVETIRSLEREVAALEGGLFGFFMRGFRDPKRYFLALFGDPDPAQPWGFRFDGHHVSLNTTAIPERPLSATPLFLGGEPRVVPEPLERAGLRVLEAEEEQAVTLLNALTPEERARAWRPWREGSAIRRPMSISDDVDLVLPPSRGLDRASLDAATRAQFDRLVDVHLGNFAPPIAQRLRREILDGDGPVTLEYAAFADDPKAPVRAGEALYYRIQGGGLSIEFDDTAEAANHIHVVIRHPANDFGRDLLADHLAGSHEP